MRRLLIRPGAIGDLIVSLPALESLKTEYTEVWAAEQNLPLIRFADRAQSITASGLDMLEIDPPAGLVERLRGFDSIVSWYGTGRREFREAVEWLGLRFEFLPAIPVGRHAVDFFVEQVKACSNQLKLVPQIDCARSLEEFAVIHPFASSRQKRWPLENFQRLAKRLQLPVCWCAGPEEELDGAVRISNLYELACWLARARVYIGNDSGITHLAAAVGTPVVALFGPTDPEVWAPRGDRVRVLDQMESVEVDEVVRAVEDI